MIRTVVGTITIVSMLAHALLGCCWHHDHDRASGSGGEHDERALADHDHDAHHDGKSSDERAAGHGHDSPEPCDHEHSGCCDEKCKSLASSRVRPLARRVLRALDLVPAPQAATVLLVQRRPASSEDDALRAAPPPLAKLTGVWLL